MADVGGRDNYMRPRLPRLIPAARRDGEETF